MLGSLQSVCPLASLLALPPEPMAEFDEEGFWTGCPEQADQDTWLADRAYARAAPGTLQEAVSPDALARCCNLPF